MNAVPKVQLHPFLKPAGLPLDMMQPILLGQLANRVLSTSDLDMPSTHYPTRQMNLYCNDFPWVLQVKRSGGVSVDQVLEFIHSELREVARNQDMPKDRVHGAYAALVRRGQGGSGKHIQRIDYLEGKTLFCGLVPFPEQGNMDWLMIFEYPRG